MIWRPRTPSPIALLDAVEKHRADPRTFSIPRRVVRETLQPRDLVKLLFAVDPAVDGIEVERMWVEVIEVAARSYRGRLDSDPTCLPRLHAGDRIEFEAKHVAARDAVAGDRLFVDPAALAVVSRAVWDNDEWPRRLERRAIADPAFSGWFVLSGDEPDEIKADATNFLPVQQASLFDRFRVLDSGLEGPIGSTMVWDDAELEYQPAAQTLDPGQSI